MSTIATGPAARPHRHGGVLAAFVLLGLLAGLLGAVAAGRLTQGPGAAGALPSPAVASLLTAVHALGGLAGWLLRRRVTSALVTRGAMLLWWAQLALQALWPLALLTPGAPAASWTVSLLLLLLDLATGAAAWTAWSVSRPAAVLLTLLAAGELAVTAAAWQRLTLQLLAGA
ncbi:MAG: hypothetical protein ACTHJL_14040 [Amnibacterium sp.]